MIEMEYLRNSKEYYKFGSCASCGKKSDEDKGMVRIIFQNENGYGLTNVILCTDCRRLLYMKI